MSRASYETGLSRRPPVPETARCEDLHDARQFSVQHRPVSERERSARTNSLGTHEAHDGLSPYGRVDCQPYRTPDQTPTSTAFNREFPAIELPVPTYDLDLERTRRSSQFSTGSSSTNGQRYSRPVERYELHRPQSMYPPVRHSYGPQREQYGPFPEDDRYPGPHPIPYAPSSFDRLSYEGSQSAHFMPSEYEYQAGKARKRSNLPKQSTEIMKDWFDHVSQSDTAT